jgi:hypothetical protein
MRASGVAILAFQLGSHDLALSGCHAKMERTKMVLSEMTPLLLVMDCRFPISSIGAGKEDA